jgi:hypothetical protein
LLVYCDSFADALVDIVKLYFVGGKHFIALREGLLFDYFDQSGFELDFICKGTD